MVCKFVRIAAVAGMALGATTVLADVIGYEDFDGGAVNLSSAANVLDYNAGGGSVGDVFGRVGPFYLGGPGAPFDVADDSVADVSGGGAFPTDALGIAGQNSSAYFGINDADGADGPGFVDATWTFDISSAISIDNINIDLAAMGDFEASSTDGFLIEARIDGNAYQEIFKGRTDEAAAMIYRALDGGFIANLNDPLELFIDGVATGTYLDKSDPTTGDFDSYTSLALAGGSGSTLDVRVSWAGTPSGSEPMGIDNITLNGTVPEPASLLLFGLGGLALIRRR